MRFRPRTCLFNISIKIADNIPDLIIQGHYICALKGRISRMKLDKKKHELSGENTLWCQHAFCGWNKFPECSTLRLKVHQVRSEGKNNALHLLCVLAEGKEGGSRMQRMD